MSHDRSETIRSLIDAALALPEGDRVGFLLERCGDEDLLRDVLEALEQRSLSSQAELSPDSLREPGEHLGPFTILEAIGSGGMGHVYRAIDTRLGREVALKVLRPEIARDEQQVRRFVREARLASRLSHPNVATIYEFGQDGEVRYIAMQLVVGRTLRECLSEGPLAPEEVARIGTEIARALAEAHALGITHRDVKTRNVMIDARGRVKVLDFGLAKSADRASISLTTPGLLVGTPESMSPEQVEGKRVDARTDVFGLGVILYEMVTGRLPFEGESVPELLARIRSETPEPPSVIRPDIPKALENIIETCLRKNAAERYPSAAEVARELEAFQRRRTNRLRRPSSVLAPLLAVALALSLWMLLQAGQDEHSYSSLAVLPLADLSISPDREYLADGLTEALIGELGRVRSLRVISRTSTMRYKGTALPVTRIAEELDVEAVLEGSIQSTAETASIQMRLVDARRDRTLWSGHYDRPLSDVLALQKEIARQVASEIGSRLEPREGEGRQSGRPVDPRAQTAYLLGRYYWNKRSARDVERAIEYFERAIEIAPEYKMAYLGLAEAYVLLTPYRGLPPSETYPRAARAARKALELDDKCGEAYGVLALIEHEFDWNQQMAEAHFQRALRHSPNSATALQWYAEFLTRSGRHEEAVPMIQRARQRDPVSLIVNSIEGWVLCYAGRYDEADAALGRVFDMDSRFLPAHIYRALVLSHRGRHDEALEALRFALELSPQNARVQASLAVAYILSGEEDEARRILQALEERSSKEWLPPYLFATIHAALGDRDATFASLESALASRGVWPLHARIDPIFDDLRDDPRWAKLARMIGFP